MTHIVHDIPNILWHLPCIFFKILSIAKAFALRQPNINIIRKTHKMQQTFAYAFLRTTWIFFEIVRFNVKLFPWIEILRLNGKIKFQCDFTNVLYTLESRLLTNRNVSTSWGEYTRTEDCKKWPISSASIRFASTFLSRSSAFCTSERFLHGKTIALQTYRSFLYNKCCWNSRHFDELRSTLQ